MGEGRVSAFVGPKSRIGALVAVTCETDFMAATDDFKSLIADLARHVADHAPKNVEELVGQKWSKTGSSVGEAIKLLIGKLGENIQVARIARFENMSGRVGAYVHHTQKVGVLVDVTTEAPEDKAAETLKELAMHAAVFKPSAASRTRTAEGQTPPWTTPFLWQ